MNASSTQTKPDIRSDVMTQEQYDYNCMHFAEFAFYTPPDQFLFHHYDDPSKVMVCWRPMAGMERYQVEDIGSGGFCGVYDTRKVSFYLKTRTWIEIPDEGYFLRNEIAQAEQALTEKKHALSMLATTPAAAPERDGGEDSYNHNTPAGAIRAALAIKIEERGA